jgi:plastocyanin
MTWLLHICSNALVVCLLGGSLEAATVTGRVQLQDSRERAVRSKSDYSGVVVWLEAPEGTPSNIRPSEHAKMLQKGKTFRPHVLAVTVGTMVDFPNLDPIFHNAFSKYDGQLFDVGLYPPGTSRSIRFTRPGFVRVFCNIHSTMSAIIAVMDTPLFAVSKQDGSFEIDGVPDGSYELRVFHERATEATLSALARRIMVSGDKLELPDVVISETGYLVLPHKNKFGRDYTPAPDDAGVYPAARQ